MSNVFRDQEKFMRACGQSVGEPNQSQYTLYKSLITEEFNELQDADNLVDELDALIDIMVVVVGALHSGGYDAEGAWKEVVRSNFSKIDKETGMVRKREDGKILKPITYSPPNLTPFITK
jgi:predicted HAD superfamily Cof-like phosphohydrolase